MNINQAKDAVNTFIDMGLPVFIWGPPGIGKSQMVQQIAKERGIACLDTRAQLLEPIDLRGMPKVDDKASLVRWIPPVFLPNEKVHGKEGLLFLDELNTASISVMNSCLQLTLDRRVGEYELPEGWQVIAAGNDSQHKAAVNRMPAPLANRFAHIPVEPDVDAFCLYGQKRDFHPMVLGFVRFKKDRLHNMDIGEKAFPTPRGWENVSKVLDREPPKGMRFKLVSAIIGETAALELEEFIETWMTLPEPEEITRQPKKARVPDSLAGQYAVASAMTRWAERKNFAAFITYLQRFERKEFELYTVLEITQRKPELVETAEYRDFALRHQSLTL